MIINQSNPKQTVGIFMYTLSRSHIGLLISLKTSSMFVLVNHAESFKNESKMVRVSNNITSNIF